MNTFSVANDVPPYFNANFFKNALEQGFRAADVQIIDAIVKNITLGGENYCSNIYNATISYRNGDSSPVKEISLIIKSMPKQKQGVLGQLGIYSKETVFYLDIKPRLEALMWHASPIWQLGARHVFSTTVPEQTIVFEDLCKQGFELKSRQLGLDKDHSTLVMQKLAQYHALTMVMATKEPEVIIDQYPFGLLNMHSIKSESFKALFGAQLLKLVQLVNKCAEFEDIAPKLLRYHDNFTERVFKAVCPLRGEINVLNHGDPWVNNFLFKYDEAKNVKEMRFIDFQLCYYGSPAFDIHYFLNTSVQLHVLQRHRQCLIAAYFASLTETLQMLPYKQPMPTYEQILHEIRQREDYGFFVAFAFFPLMSMISLDSEDNSLEKLQDQEFASRKIELMFESNGRTMETLKYTLKRVNDLGVLD